MGFAAALQPTCFDVDVQHVSRPAMRNSVLRISQPQLGVFKLSQKHQVVPPRQLSNSLLDNFSIRPGLRIVEPPVPTRVGFTRHWLGRCKWRAIEGDPGCFTMDMIQAGQQVHEEMVLALVKGMADKSLRGDLENLLQISITLWGFTHGTIQLAQTKNNFMTTMGISKESFMNQAVELVMQSLINRTGGGKK